MHAWLLSCIAQFHNYAYNYAACIQCKLCIYIYTSAYLVVPIYIIIVTVHVGVCLIFFNSVQVATRNKLQRTMLIIQDARWITHACSSKGMWLLYLYIPTKLLLPATHGQCQLSGLGIATGSRPSTKVSWNPLPTHTTCTSPPIGCCLHATKDGARKA